MSTRTDEVSTQVINIHVLTTKLYSKTDNKSQPKLAFVDLLPMVSSVFFAERFSVLAYLITSHVSQEIYQNIFKILQKNIISALSYRYSIF